MVRTHLCPDLQLREEWDTPDWSGLEYSPCAPVPSTTPGSELPAASVCSSRLKHVRVCIRAALLVHGKECLRGFHFWLLQGFLSGSPGLLGGNWTLKVAQVSGNSGGMSSCLEVQNLEAAMQDVARTSCQCCWAGV